MSLNSFVTADGAEIGRAQAMQAAAAGIEPHARMNPVLLKPGSDRRAQVVLLGHPVAEVDAVEYRDHKAALLEVALDSLAAPDTCFAAVRRAQLDVMGDLVASHLDTAVLSRLIGEGPPAGLPVIGPAGAGSGEAMTRRR
jgi:hypothetical protein